MRCFLVGGVCSRLATKALAVGLRLVSAPQSQGGESGAGSLVSSLVSTSGSVTLESGKGSGGGARGCRLWRQSVVLVIQVCHVPSAR